MDQREQQHAVRILLVEDNTADAELIELELSVTSGVTFEVDHVTRLASAVSRLQQRGADLVLLDLGLPDSSGIETFEAVRASALHTPIILLTGLADEELALRTVQAGAQDYLLKGKVDRGLLIRSIRHAMEREQTRRKIQLLNEELEQRVQDRTRELEASNRALQEAYEDLRELDRMKTTFIRVTSHELTTPVQVVHGMLSILQLLSRDSHESHEEALATALNGATRLQRMVTRVLEMAHAGEYPQRVARSTVQPDLLLQNVRAQVAPFTSLRRQRLGLEVQPDLPPVVADLDKIRDVLLNLVMNAVKFSPDGSAITLCASREGEGPVRFTVIDSGLGISEADRPHVFLPFFSSFDTLHHSSGEYEFNRRGLGLGLAIAKEFVEMHGGKIWLERTSSEGSAFCFTLPAAQ